MPAPYAAVLKSMLGNYHKNSMKRIHYIGLSVILFLGIVLTGAHPLNAQQAEGFHIQTRVHMAVKPDVPELHMTHDVQVTNQTDDALSRLDFALPVSQTDDMRVVYPDGSNIPFKTAQQHSKTIHRSFRHAELSLDFPRDVAGNGETWSFEISYDTAERIQSNGGNMTIGLPLLDGGVADSWRAEVDAPASLPGMNYYPPVSEFSRSDDTNQFVFTDKKIGQNFLGISFADSQTHTLNMTTLIRNSWPVTTTKSITLPPDLHNQTAFLDSIEPQPDAIRVDKNGNIIADYRLWPWQRKTVSAMATVRTRQLRYDPANAKSISETPDALMGYTSSGKYWPKDGVVAEHAKEVVEEDADAWSAVQGLHEFVQNEFTVKSGLSNRRPADKVLDDRAGNVHNIADTLIALLRSQDVPVRLVEGVIYPGNSPVAEQQVHAWVEAYVAGIGWVTLDPVWADMFDSFGYSSSNRVAMRVRSGHESWSEAQSLNDAAYTLQAAGELPEQKDGSEQIRVETARRIVFPGIVHDKRTVHNDSGYVIDDVYVENAFAGSLAPQATLTREAWQFAGFNGFTTRWHVGDQQPRTVTSRMVWWPLAIPGVLLLVGGVIQFYRHRLKRYMRSRLDGIRLR